MENCSPGKVPIFIGESLRKLLGSHLEFERLVVKEKLYVAIVGSLNYSQIFTFPDLSFVI